MIVRARTEINEDYILNILRGAEVKPVSPPESFFFLDSGSSALRMFLRTIGPGKRVGLQVYTCPTVLDALVEENCTPVFLDINSDYYTTTIDIVRGHIEEIDVLLLTHLFGIPNPDYIEIKEFCISKGVVLIDDLCQTFHAKVEGTLLEDLSDNYFYSFFYDKPISMLSGGMLKIEDRFISKANSIYKQLPSETEIDGKRGLKTLLLMHRILSPSVYKGEFRTGSLWKKLLGLWPMTWNIIIGYQIMTTKVFRGIDRISGKLIKRERNPFRMSVVRQQYVMLMMNSFHHNNKILQKFLSVQGIVVPKYLSNNKISCSLAKRAIIRSHLKSLEAEVSLYNWPKLLCEDSQYYLYPKATSVMDECINVPIWTDEICNLVGNDMSLINTWKH